jgi:regulating synaptic membrane exocytosis protein 2
MINLNKKTILILILIIKATYVKLYMFSGRTCIEKQRTTLARRTLDPMYQQNLQFVQNYQGNILQMTVWGDFGKLDRKVFIGIAQIVLDDIKLPTMNIGWYKLYSISSIIADIHSMTASVNDLCDTDSSYSFMSDSNNSNKN